MQYAALLEDPRWQKRRLEIFQRDEFTCVRCLRTDLTLVVHHRHYTAHFPWDEPEYNLETLCRPCHKKEHANGNWLYRLRQMVGHAHACREWDQLWEVAHLAADEEIANDNGMGGV